MVCKLYFCMFPRNIDLAKFAALYKVFLKTKMTYTFYIIQQMIFEKLTKTYRKKTWLQLTPEINPRLFKNLIGKIYFLKKEEKDKHLTDFILRKDLICTDAIEKITKERSRKKCEIYAKQK